MKWALVDKSGGEAACWPWLGSTTQRGYGNHRKAYKELVGPIPAGMQLDHLCRNPPCCNPAHLEVVTPAENMRRATLVRDGAGYRIANPRVLYTPDDPRHGRNATYGEGCRCIPCRRARKKWRDGNEARLRRSAQMSSTATFNEAAS